LIRATARRLTHVPEIVTNEPHSTRAAINRNEDLGSTIMIIGGGVGGMTAALALQHFRIAVRVFEQAGALRKIGAGVTITPNAMHALDFLGIGKRIAGEAGAVPRYQVCNYSTGAVMEYGPDPAAIEPNFGAGYYNLHRADLHSAMVDAINANDPGCIVLDHRFSHESMRMTARNKIDSVNLSSYLRIPDFTGLWHFVITKMRHAHNQVTTLGLS